MNPRKKTTRGDDEAAQCQEAIGYLFRRHGLLRKALTHSSVKDERNPSNERMEFLGDAILGVVISEYLFSLLPGKDEGDLTKIKSVVVSSQTLSRLGLELGLDRYLYLGKGIRLKREIPRSLVANAVEAIIAAVYLDRGMEAARHFVLDHLHPYVQEVLDGTHEEKNYKSILQQTAQREFSGTPAYRVVGERGPDHSRIFRVAAVIGGREFPCGAGNSKKEAEQDAARIALEAIEEERGRGGRKRQGRKRSTRVAVEPVAREADNGRSAPPPARPARPARAGRSRMKAAPDAEPVITPEEPPVEKRRSRKKATRRPDPKGEAPREDEGRKVASGRKAEPSRPADAPVAEDRGGRADTRRDDTRRSDDTRRRSDGPRRRRSARPSDSSRQEEAVRKEAPVRKEEPVRKEAPVRKKAPPRDEPKDRGRRENGGGEKPDPARRRPRSRRGRGSDAEESR